MVDSSAIRALFGPWGTSGRADAGKCALGADSVRWFNNSEIVRQEEPDGYSGYGIQDFLEVSPKLGTGGAPQHLVRPARARCL